MSYKYHKCLNFYKRKIQEIFIRAWLGEASFCVWSVHIQNIWVVYCVWKLDIF